jgi:hypothetical protein
LASGEPCNIGFQRLVKYAVQGGSGCDPSRGTMKGMPPGPVGIRGQADYPLDQPWSFDRSLTIALRPSPPAGKMHRFLLADQLGYSADLLSHALMVGGR